MGSPGTRSSHHRSLDVQDAGDVHKIRLGSKLSQITSAGRNYTTLVSSIMAGKSPRNGGFNGKITYFNGPFSSKPCLIEGISLWTAWAAGNQIQKGPSLGRDPSSVGFVCARSPLIIGLGRVNAKKMRNRTPSSDLVVCGTCPQTCSSSSLS